RNPHPDGLLLRVQQPPRHLLGGGQDERVLPRSRRLDRTEHRVVDVDELAQLGEVLAHEREVVPVVEPADAPDAVETLTVVERGAEREARVGRVGDQPSLPDEVHDLPDRTRLWVVRMHVVVDRHGGHPKRDRGYSPSRMSSRVSSPVTWNPRNTARFPTITRNAVPSSWHRSWARTSALSPDDARNVTPLRSATTAMGGVASSQAASRAEVSCATVPRSTSPFARTKTASSLRSAVITSSMCSPSPSSDARRVLPSTTAKGFRRFVRVCDRRRSHPRGPKFTPAAQ